MARETHKPHNNAQYRRSHDGHCGDLDRVEHAHKEGSRHVIRVAERNYRLANVESCRIVEKGKAAVDVTFRKIVRHVHGHGGKEAYKNKNQYSLNRVFAAFPGLFALFPSSIAINTKRVPG